MSFVILAVCVLILFLGSFYYLKNYERNKLIGSIPGSNGKLLFGDALNFWVPRDELIHSFKDFFKEYRKYGLAKSWFGHRPIIVLFNAETVEPLLTSSTNLSKALFYDFLLPWLGTGLLTSTDEKWLRRRKLLTPAFHFRILDDFAPIINEHSETLVRNLEVFAGKEQCDVFKYITLCTLDIICATAMGRNLNAQTLSDSEYVKAVST